MASDKIKCTFEECYQRFNTVGSMKRHKSKAEDEVHEWYCKKCDEDCEDDIAYLIHQIQSRKHIACPVCGAEFKSEGGRDRHVGINHRRKQEIKCPGCQVTFESASALMGHIEGNKCKTITRDDFHKHRAEQQIEREALEDLMNGEYQNSGVINTMASKPDTSHGGMSLLDNERVNMDRDWQGNPQPDPRTSAYGNSSTQRDTLSQGMSDLAINKYPPLRAARADRSNLSQSGTGASSTLQRKNSDLLDMQEEPEVWSNKPNTIIGNHNVWTNNKLTNSQPRPQPRAPSSNLLESTSSVNLFGSTVSTNTAATQGSRPTTNPWNTNNSWNNPTADKPLPPAARPENADPNPPYATIQTAAPKRPVPSRLDLHRYWDTIQSCYICPSSKCNARIASVKAFEEHLASAIHTMGKVQCPSCLKKFNTTTALVAHAESGSTKCDLRNSAEYDLALRSITAGLIRVDGTWRDGSVKYESVPVDRW